MAHATIERSIIESCLMMIISQIKLWEVGRMGGVLLNLKYFALLLAFACKGIEIDKIMRKHNIMDNREPTTIYDSASVKRMNRWPSRHRST